MVLPCITTAPSTAYKNSSGHPRGGGVVLALPRAIVLARAVVPPSRAKVPLSSSTVYYYRANYLLRKSFWIPARKWRGTSIRKYRQAVLPCQETVLPLTVEQIRVDFWRIRIWLVFLTLWMEIWVRVLYGKSNPLLNRRGDVRFKKQHTIEQNTSTTSFYPNPSCSSSSFFVVLRVVELRTLRP